MFFVRNINQHVGVVNNNEPVGKVGVSTRIIAEVVSSSLKLKTKKSSNLVEFPAYSLLELVEASR